MLDVTPWLGPERAALLDVCRDLGPDAWAAPTECPAWTVGGVALHVLGDDLSLLSRQRDDAANGLLLYAADHPGLSFRQLLDGFNERWVQAAGFLSAELVVELLGLTGAWTEAWYRSVDPEAPGEPVGFFASAGRPSPWWQVAAREYVERWIHQAQIRRAVGAPPVADELSAPAIDAVVRGLGARIPGLARFAVGDRTWDLAGEGGSGGDGGAGAAVALDPGDAALVLSRGLPLEETTAALRGDAPGVVAAVAEQTCRGQA